MVAHETDDSDSHGTEIAGCWDIVWVTSIWYNEKLKWVQKKEKSKVDEWERMRGRNMVFWIKWLGEKVTYIWAEAWSKGWATQMLLGGAPGQRDLNLERSQGQVKPCKFRRAACRMESQVDSEHRTKAGPSALESGLYSVFLKGMLVPCLILSLW